MGDSNKIYPVAGESEPPPPYMPYEPAATTGVPPGMMGNMAGNNAMMNQMAAMMNQMQAVQSSPWLTPGVAGAMALLDDVDMVSMTQQFDTMNIMVAAFGKKFKVQNNQGAVLFIVGEDENSIPSIRNYRAFDLNVKDCNGQVVFTITRGQRPCSYCAFCCACCDSCRADADVLENGRSIGQLRQKCSFNKPYYHVLDGDGNKVMELVGESACCLPANVYFVTNCSDGKQATIHRSYGAMGMLSSNYKIMFPKEWDARTKANCIGLAMLMNFRFHSNRPGGGRRRGRR